MSYIAAIFCGLVLMNQVMVIQGDTGICILCKDYLNAAQCNAAIFGLCYFSRGVCVSLYAGSTPATCVQKSFCTGYDGSNTTQKCLSTNGICSSFDGSQACSTYTDNKQCQALKKCTFNSTASYSNSYDSSSGTCLVNTCNNLGYFSCSGKDGVNPNLQCYSPTGTYNCSSFDSTQACSSFSYQQCRLSTNCYWTPSNANNSYVGNCSNNACSQYNSSSSCSFVVTSFSGYSASPCKWTINQTTNTGTCGSGQASDLVYGNCGGNSLLFSFFTWSDSSSVCTACTNTFNSTATNASSSQIIVLNILFAVLMIVLGW